MRVPPQSCRARRSSSAHLTPQRSRRAACDMSSDVGKKMKESDLQMHSIIDSQLFICVAPRRASRGLQARAGAAWRARF